jgi:hypothetical protein
LAVAPVAKLARRQQADRALEQDWREQAAHPLHVSGQPAAQHQVALVVVERLREREWLGRTLATHLLSRAGLRGPEIEHVDVVGVLEIVGDAEPLGPGPALAVGAAHQPRAGAPVLAVAERDAGCDRDEVGFSADLELGPCRPRFERGRAEAAGHDRACPASVR